MKDFKIWFDNKRIFLKTKEGIEKSMPLSWFSRLESGTKDEREDFELSPFGIHWPKIDENLSFEGFIKFKNSI